VGFHILTGRVRNVNQRRNRHLSDFDPAAMATTGPVRKSIYGVLMCSLFPEYQRLFVDGSADIPGRLREPLLLAP
jgi:hypothetical protein